MPIKHFATISGAALLMLTALGAEAATLTPHGTVLINRGNGFERVTDPSDCQPGDMIMVNDGRAKLTYNDGRGHDLEPGQVYTCGNETVAAPSDGAGGVAGAGGIGGLSGTTLVIGGIAVAAGIAGIVVLSRGDSSSSP